MRGPKRSKNVVVLVVIAVMVVWWLRSRGSSHSYTAVVETPEFDLKRYKGAVGGYVYKGDKTYFDKIYKCEEGGSDDLGKNTFPEKLSQTLFPEGKKHLRPFPPPIAAYDAQMKAIAKAQQTPGAPTPTCYPETGICECKSDKEQYLFNGHKCIPSWGSDPYKALRERWANAPLRVANANTNLKGAEYVKFWEEKAMFKDHWTTAYAGMFRGKTVLDVGCGYARQSFVFALHGALVTFVDLAPENLERVRILAKHYGVEERVQTLLLTSVDSLEKGLGTSVFDVVLFFGSMHHMPREYIKKEVAVYFAHMRKGSRLIQLAYPSSRWYCAKSPDFPEFCASTDYTCPWAEWYDIDKALATFAPHRFIVLYAGTVGADEFSWWDLVYEGPPEIAASESEN